MSVRKGAALAAGLGGLLLAGAASAQCAPQGCQAWAPASPAYAVAPPPAYGYAQQAYAQQAYAQQAYAQQAYAQQAYVQEDRYGAAAAASGYGAANRYGEGYGYVAAGPCNVCAVPAYARPQVIVAPPQEVEVAPSLYYGSDAGGVVGGEALGGGGGGGGSSGLGQFEAGIGSANAFGSANAMSEASALGQAYANASVQADAYAKSQAYANAQAAAKASASASASSSSSSAITVNIQNNHPYPKPYKPSGGCSQCGTGGQGMGSWGGGVGSMGGWGGHKGGGMAGWSGGGSGGVGSMGGWGGRGGHRGGCGCKK